MKTALAREEPLVLTISENKDPHSFDRNPSLVVFTAPGQDTLLATTTAADGDVCLGKTRRLLDTRIPLLIC